MTADRNEAGSWSVTGKPGSAGRENNVPGPAKTPDQDPVFSEPRAFSQHEGGQNASESLYDMSMGKASRTKGDSDRRARIAQQREAERRAAQRKRIYWAGGSILVVAIVVIALFLFKLNSGSSTTASNGPTGAALTTVTKQVTDVPVSVTDQVASGGVPNAMLVSAPTSADISSASSKLGSYFATVSGTALTSAGKPEVLYLGGEYCPFCAAQRWAIVNSLSRFGTFTGLKTTHSSSTDADPNTPTFTFYGSKYTSNYVTFTPVEEYSNTPSGNGYTTLQTPTAAQQAVGRAYDPSGSIPFISIANKFVQVGNLSPLSPTLLSGKTWAQVAAAMNDPSSKIGQAIIGNANYMTAGICKVIDNKATSACTPTIQKLEANLAS
jgi:thiol-disulfide isomerase/thioredoxin